MNRSRYGCHIGNTYMGASGYADNVAISVKSLHGLKYMISLYEEYADEYHIKCNPLKSKPVCYNVRKE